MSWGGSEKNRWFQLDVSISMLWSSSGELGVTWCYRKPFHKTIYPKNQEYLFCCLLRAWYALSIFFLMLGGRAARTEGSSWDGDGRQNSSWSSLEVDFCRVGVATSGSEDGSEGKGVGLSCLKPSSTFTWEDAVDFCCERREVMREKFTRTI